MRTWSLEPGLGGIQESGCGFQALFPFREPVLSLLGHKAGKGTLALLAQTSPAFFLASKQFKLYQI